MKCRLAFWLGLAVSAVLAAMALIGIFRGGHSGLLYAGINGICREILRGSTEGRQALVGSCWHGPLPTLFALPFMAVLDGYWGFFGCLAAQFAALWLMLLGVGTLAPRNAVLRVGLQIAAVAAVVALRNCVDWQLGMSLALGLIAVLIRALWDWTVRGGAKSVVGIGFSSALLLWCGAQFFVPVAAALLWMLLAALRKRDLRCRMQAWFLLGCGPVLYVLAVWMLLNRLVMNDWFYFLRPYRLGSVAEAFHNPGYFRNDIKTAHWSYKSIEEYVKAKSQYARVFVVGYAGLDLLRHYGVDGCLTPNMDLHVGDLRYAYKGQHLFVLVPKPEGIAKFESVFWRYPDIYTRGAERLLLDRDFADGWRLFEVVAAPTQEQLDEWN